MSIFTKETITQLKQELGIGEQKQEIIATKSDTPKLSSAEKQQLKNLMDQYLDNKKLFVYDGSFRRESYAYAKTVSSLSGSINGCMYKGQYIMNCALFAQMIWMGRSISDFKATSPSTIINKAFNWGYYFDFNLSRIAYGKKNGTKFYAFNTYEGDSGTTQFINFDNASNLAQELYQIGCEIPYSEIETGDLVFYRSPDISDGETDALEQTSFRYITHVGVVYDVTEYGPIIYESSSSYSACIGRMGPVSPATTFGQVRYAGYSQKVVMAARHPRAFGKECNVPNKFETYRGKGLK